MEAWYGDCVSSCESDSGFDDLPAESTSRALTKASKRDKLIALSTPLSVAEAERPAAVASSDDYSISALDVIIPITVCSLVIIFIASSVIGVGLSFALAFFILGTAVATTTYFIDAPPKPKLVEIDADADQDPIWDLILSIGGDRMREVRDRCDRFMALTSDDSCDLAALAARRTIARDLGNLTAAYQAAYKPARPDQQIALQASLLNSVEMIGVLASREHERILRDRLDNFDTHRRYVDAKTADAADGPISA